MRAISLSLNFKPQLCKIELKKKNNTSFVFVHKANPKLPTTMTNDA